MQPRNIEYPLRHSRPVKSNIRSKLPKFTIYSMKTHQPKSISWKKGNDIVRYKWRSRKRNFFLLLRCSHLRIFVLGLKEREPWKWCLVVGLQQKNQIFTTGLGRSCKYDRIATWLILMVLPRTRQIDPRAPQTAACGSWEPLRPAIHTQVLQVTQMSSVS